MSNMMQMVIELNLSPYTVWDCSKSHWESCCCFNQFTFARH